MRDNAKRALVKAAKDHGFAFDTKAGGFVTAETTTVDPVAQPPAPTEPATTTMVESGAEAAAVTSKRQRKAAA